MVIAKARRLSAWCWRPVTCTELAEAMYRASQSRREVKSRLGRMGRWMPGTIHAALWEAECALDLVFPHGNGATERAWREAAE